MTGFTVVAGDEWITVPSADWVPLAVAELRDRGHADADIAVERDKDAA